MSLVPLGSMGIGVAVPGAAASNVALGVVCSIAAPNVSGQITALGSFVPVLSPNLAQQLAMAEQIIANIEAAIAAFPPIPTLSLQAQIDLALTVRTNLLSLLDLITLKVTLQAEIAALLATAGVSAYAWDGANNALGAALTTELGPSAVHSNALILHTVSGTTWTAMQSFFKTTP